MINNIFFSVFFVWKTPYMFSLMKKKYNSGPTCRKHWHDHRQMEYAKYNKCHHISDFISFLLCAVSQVRCRWDGGIWIMEREPARDDMISLKVEPSTVAIAQETEKHKPDQHLTHSTSVMSYSETWAFKHALHTSPLFLHTLLVARICMLCVITTERYICLKFVTKAFRCLNI